MRTREPGKQMNSRSKRAVDQLPDGMIPESNGPLPPLGLVKLAVQEATSNAKTLRTPRRFAPRGLASVMAFLLKLMPKRSHARPPISTKVAWSLKNCNPVISQANSFFHFLSRLWKVTLEPLRGVAGTRRNASVRGAGLQRDHVARAASRIDSLDTPNHGSIRFIHGTP